MRGSGLFQGKETSRAKAKAWPSNKASEFVYIIWAKLERHPGLGGSLAYVFLGDTANNGYLAICIHSCFGEGYKDVGLWVSKIIPT